LNNYKLLPALISLLQTRNLTESAKALHVTQSAMSKTLGQIREAFDDAILIREANRFVLTQRAEILKQQLPALMQQLDSLYLPESLNLAQCQRQFSFASSDYVAQAVFPRVCEAVERNAPNAGIVYQLWDKSHLERLAELPLDLVSTIAQTIPENLYGKEMATDSQVVLMRSSHPLAGQHLSLDDYAKAKHIVITGGGDKDSPVESALAKQGKQRTVFARVPFFQAAIELIKSTDTLLTTPLHIAVDFSQRYDIKIKPLPVDIEAHHYYLLWHAKYQKDPEHQWFRALCFTILSKHLNDSIAQGMKLLHGN
jgi:DNA-binding transcriptional LysR family regulator